MISLSKEKLAGLLLAAALCGGVVSYHVVPPPRDRPVLKFLQGVLRTAGLIWIFGDATPTPPHQHITHMPPVTNGEIDHRKAF